MKKALVLLLIVAGTTWAQLSPPVVDQQVRSEMTASTHERGGSSNFAITSGYAGFMIDDVARRGFSVDLRAVLARVSPLRIELNTGVVLYNSSVSSTQAPVYSPNASRFNYMGQEQYTQPRFNLNFAMAYVGSEAVYYLTEGKVRPYVGAGVEAVSWQMSQGLAGALTPTARAGLEVAMKSNFSGFAEVRYLYGTRNLLTPYPSSLSYVTTLAFGVSFAPQL